MHTSDSACSGLQFSCANGYPFLLPPPGLLPDVAGSAHDCLDGRYIKFFSIDVGIIKALNLSWQGWCNLRSKERQGLRKRWERQNGNTRVFDCGVLVLRSQIPPEISAAGIPYMDCSNFFDGPNGVPNVVLRVCATCEHCQRTRSRTPTSSPATEVCSVCQIFCQHMRTCWECQNLVCKACSFWCTTCRRKGRKQYTICDHCHALGIYMECDGRHVWQCTRCREEKN